MNKYRAALIGSICMIIACYSNLSSFAQDPVTHHITVQNFSFTPSNLVINEGDIVVWTNINGFHNVNGTSTTFPENTESFGLSPASSPWTYSYTFTIPGSNSFRCDVHPSVMTGTITVMEVIESAFLNGSVSWNSDCGERAATIKLYETGSDVLVEEYNTVVDADGIFNIPEIEIGTFDIYGKVSGYLQKGFNEIELISGENNLPIGAVTAGDVNNDNFINIIDVSLINVAFNSSSADANYNILSDLNCDELVNIIDISVLNSGFGNLGDAP